MRPAGRPLRFLAVVVGGWMAVRVAMLWPSIGSPADAIGAVAPIAKARTLPAGAARRVGARVPVAVGADSLAIRSTPRDAVPLPEPITAATRTAPFRRARPPAVVLAAVPARSLPLAPRGLPARSRWSGSGWLVLRQGGGTGSAFGGSQLGGSQAGLRIAYTIDRGIGLALAARLSAPLSGTGREAAIGIEWQPAALPIRIVAEERLSLDGGRGGPTLGLIGGVAPLAIAPGATIEAYGQAGAIAREDIEMFADGAVRVAHDLFDLGAVRLDIGAGAWGAAQRDAARLDIGPSLSADLPIGKAHVRLSVDWRARVAGEARPGSGLVLTLGTDF